MATVPDRGLGPVTRRTALGVSALGLGALLTACGAPEADPVPVPRDPEPTADREPVTPSPEPEPLPEPEPAPPQAPVLDRVPAPTGPFTALPGEGNLMALTLDDGADGSVIAGYAAWAAATGARLTMFATGSYPAWAENAEALRPLVASGQVQMANHTWSHPNLTALSDQAIVDELQATHDLIGDLFGVDARPFYRPPYGYYDGRVLAAAASIGYTAPTMWYGTLGDSGYQPPEVIVQLAQQWFLPQHIVIGHLNVPSVTQIFYEFDWLLADRGLTTVTLNDVFTSEFHP
jgi:peptidoglycan/xylan/chitin deacetylase (PgdA/CDA1 family)